MADKIELEAIYCDCKPWSEKDRVRPVEEPAATLFDLGFRQRDLYSARYGAIRATVAPGGFKTTNNTKQTEPFTVVLLDEAVVAVLPGDRRKKPRKRAVKKAVQEAVEV